MVRLVSRDQLCSYLYDSFAFYAKREGRIGKFFQQPNIVATSMDEVSSNAAPLVRQIKKLPERAKKLIEMLPHQEVCCSV